MVFDDLGQGVLNNAYEGESLSCFCVGFCPGSDHQNLPTAPGQISLMTWNIAILITFHTLDIFTCAGRSEGQVTLVGLTKEQRR